MKKQKERIFFNLPEDTTLVSVIDEILKDHGLEESDEEFFDKDIKGIEPRLIIVRDAAIVMAEKKIPEKKLVDLLKKHLEITHQIAQGIVKDIHEKLIPFVEVFDLEKAAELRRQEEEIERRKAEAREQREKKERELEEEKEELFRKAKEELLEKIRAKTPEPEPQPVVEEELPTPPVKKIDIKDVEKNAEIIRKNKSLIEERDRFEEKNQGDQDKPPQKKKTSDTYREPIE